MLFLFIHSFIQHIFTAYLLCTRHHFMYKYNDWNNSIYSVFNCMTYSLTFTFFNTTVVSIMLFTFSFWNQNRSAFQSERRRLERCLNTESRVMIFKFWLSIISCTGAWSPLSASKPSLLCPVLLFLFYPYFHSRSFALSTV